MGLLTRINSIALLEESELAAKLKNSALLVASNPIIRDVGANSGYLAAEILLKLKPSCLDLFEPNLVHQLTLDSLAAFEPRARVHMVGLSDHSGPNSPCSM